MLPLLPLVVRATGAVTIRTFVPLACLLAVPAAAGGPMRTFPHLRACLSVAATTIAMPPLPAPPQNGPAPDGPPTPLSTCEQTRGHSTGVPAQRLLAPDALPPLGGTAPAAPQHALCLVDLRQASSRLQLAREAHTALLISVADLQVHLALEERRAAEAAREATHAQAAMVEAKRGLRLWNPRAATSMSPAPHASGPGTHFPVFLPATQRAAFEAWIQGLDKADDEVIIIGNVSNSSVLGPVDPATRRAPI